MEDNRHGPPLTHPVSLSGFGDPRDAWLREAQAGTHGQEGPCLQLPARDLELTGSTLWMTFQDTLSISDLPWTDYPAPSMHFADLRPHPGSQCKTTRGEMSHGEEFGAKDAGTGRLPQAGRQRRAAESKDSGPEADRAPRQPRLGRTHSAHSCPCQALPRCSGPTVPRWACRCPLLTLADAANLGPEAGGPEDGQHRPGLLSRRPTPQPERTAGVGHGRGGLPAHWPGHHFPTMALHVFGPGSFFVVGTVLCRLWSGTS